MLLKQNNNLSKVPHYDTYENYYNNWSSMQFNIDILYNTNNICRYCLEPVLENINICNCTSSIHADCLAIWRAYSNRTQCEICNFVFSS